MTSRVYREDYSDVAVLTIDSPPVNALNAAVRSQLVALLAAVVADDTCHAIVITAAGRDFSGGADINEFDKTMVEPQLPEMIRLIEACPKPVYAALKGIVFGGGLESAMACRFRVAAADAKLGLPEVKIGLVPGGGGTQRLTRLVGVEKALSMILKGDPIGAEDALACGLVDKVVTGPLLEGTLAFVRETQQRPLPPLARDRDVAVADENKYLAARKANARLFRNLDVPEAIVEAIRAATTLPFDQGLAVERRLSLASRASAQSKGLRHAFFAERRAAKVDGLSAAPRSVETVGVIGAGTMGSGIATCFLRAGVPVTLIEQEQDALDRGTATIAKFIESDVSSGRMTQAAAAAALGRLTASLDWGTLEDADLVIEAAFELIEIKQAIFERLDAVTRPHAILATNTSYLDVNAIAAATQRPERILGLHFFSPAHVMKLLEIVRADHTADDVLATGLAIARRIGKIPVVSGVCHGFIGNRMLAVRRREADAMILEGASPSDVDRVAEDFGFPMGPFRVSDLSGLDLGWTAQSSTGQTVRERLCEIGRRGLKSGAGYYDYNGNRAEPSPVVDALIEEVAAARGIGRRAIKDAEIRSRLLEPMIAEGKKILSEGIAARASDIDVVWLNGYGWPRHTGGPMFWAETQSSTIPAAVQD